MIRPMFYLVVDSSFRGGWRGAGGRDHRPEEVGLGEIGGLSILHLRRPPDTPSYQLLRLKEDWVVYTESYHTSTEDDIKPLTWGRAVLLVAAVDAGGRHLVHVGELQGRETRLGAEGGTVLVDVFYTLQCISLSSRNTTGNALPSSEAEILLLQLVFDVILTSLATQTC